jgi:hypothetical protein
VAPALAAMADAAPGVRAKAAPGSVGSSSGAATPGARPAPGAPAAAAATDSTAAAADPGAPLPPIDTLGPDADYSGFFKPSVAPSLRNAALKKLFADPRFNVMDGLDTYIDDYSVTVPMSAEEARGLVQARAILNPPRMRVNAQGHVEPVPPEVLAAEATAGGAAAEAPTTEVPATATAEGPTTETSAAEAAATDPAASAAVAEPAPARPLPEPAALPPGAPAPSRHR